MGRLSTTDCTYLPTYLRVSLSPELQRGKKTLVARALGKSPWQEPIQARIIP